MSDPKSNIQELGELHKAGMITDEQMLRAVKQYSEFLLSPQIAIDPAAQHIPGSFQMHAHNLKNPMNPANHSHKINTMSGVGQAAQARVPTPYIPEKEELRRVLGVRLRARPGDTYPLEFIDFHVAKDRVYVFCVAKEGATIIEDDIWLFPSDALITAINLLKG